MSAGTPRALDVERAWLLLWDIDGTLLRDAAGAHALAILRALEHVHGIDPRPGLGVPSAGMTDAAIARAILREVGVADAEIDARQQDVAAHALEVLDVPDLRGHVVDGVDGLLVELAGRGDVVHGLVTGNHEPIARRKLEAAGIGHHFDAGLRGGFGSDSEAREPLPGIARERAGAALRPDGAPWPRERTVVIGDTARDIACARHDGVAVIAVRTGPHPDADLSGADAVAADAAELRAALVGRVDAG